MAKGYQFYILVFFVIISTIPFKQITAQQENEIKHVTDFIELMNKNQQAEQNRDPFQSRPGFTNSVINSSEREILTPRQTLNLSANPDPNLNVPFNGSGQWTMDINGDGLGDYLYRGFPRDINTSQLDDNSPKTLVFFGGNISEIPDQILPYWLTPVRDINRDGFVDAIDHQDGTIFFGSPDGFASNGLNLARPDMIANDQFGIDNTLFGTSDLDGDGVREILLHKSSDEFAVFWGDQTQSDVPNAESVFAVDLTGNGLYDVLSVSSSTNEVVWFENTGGNQFSSKKVITNNAERAQDVYAADLDGDGLPDVLSASEGDNKVAWYRNEGNGNFSDQIIIVSQFANAKMVRAYDVDGDGDLDIIAASNALGKISWFENQGNGNFGDETIITEGHPPLWTFLVKDVDGDGSADLLFASFNFGNGDRRIAWIKNEGAGNFGPVQIISESLEGAFSLDAADLDSDGDIDVAAIGIVTNRIVWFENDGEENFSNEIVIATEEGFNGVLSVIASDIDSDGDEDIIVAGSGSESGLFWYENDGAGSFSPAKFIDQEVPISIFARDINDDGIPELFAASVSGTVSWYTNQEGSLLDTQNDLNTIVEGEPGKEYTVFNNDDSTGLLTEAIYNSADVNGDGIAEVFVWGKTGSGIEEIRIFGIDSNRNGKTLQQKFQIPDGITEGDIRDNNIYVLDIDGNGFHEIIIRNPNLFVNSKVHIYTEDVANGGQYNPQPAEIFTGLLYPVGDLNRDGKMDFHLADSDNSSTPFVGFGKDDPASTLTLDFPLITDDESVLNFENSYLYPIFGDFNGDGIHDYVLGEDIWLNMDREGMPRLRREQVGRRFVFGSEDGNLTRESSSSPAEHFFDVAPAAMNLGDVNGDEREDFGIYHSDRRQLFVFYGGKEITEIPDFILDVEMNAFVLSEGDFDGDGFSDLIITPDGGEVNHFLVFHGSETGYTQKTLFESSDIISTKSLGNDLVFGRNIGDINNDGIDDFSVSTLFQTKSDGTLFNELLIFFGATELSNTPDIRIDFNQILGINGEVNLWQGWGLTSLGDFNGDGIDDFAASTAFIEVPNGTGQVHIFFGSDNPDFSTPDMVIQSELLESGFGDILTSGDFNGDGYNDLFVKTLGPTPSGYQQIYLYAGGPEADNLSDATLVAAPSDFGRTTDADFSGGGFHNMAIIPDYNGDGRDEIIISSFYEAFDNSTNAIIYEGRELLEEKILPGKVLQAPNQEIGFGWHNVIETIAIGDFSGSGRTDIILTQSADNNDAYRSSRQYIYQIELSVSVSVTENISAAEGGSVEDT